MLPQPSYQFFGKRFSAILHNVALIAILHNTFIAPSQGIIEAYLNKSVPLITNALHAGKVVNSINSPLAQPIVGFSNTNTYLPTETSKNTFITSSDAEGYIGISEQKPFDNPSDNVFRLDIDNEKIKGKKLYLTYDMYGLGNSSGIARSINNRMAIGGYIAKSQYSWTECKEEIDGKWLINGENIILFTLPKGSPDQCVIKNLKIEVSDNDNSVSKLVLNKDQGGNVFIKDDAIFVRGFVRGRHKNLRVVAGTSILIPEDGEFEAVIPVTDQMKKAGVLAINAYSEDEFIAQELLFIDNLVEADRAFKFEEKSNVFTHKFSDIELGVLRAGAASIAIDKGALLSETKISIRELRNIDIAPMNQGMVNVTPGAKAYRLSPDGTKFEKNVNLTIPYDSLRIPVGYSAKDIRTYFFDTHLKTWRVIEKDSIDQRNNTIISKTNHFTDYINGVIQAPESPETTAFAPTSMSDIKAADPAAEITLISPPEASHNGGANISYPIKIPAGRKGMQPNISLNYSNQDGSGWLGLGWGIATSSLTIDTRWGVPQFDPVNESEVYNLDGEMLMYPQGYLPHRHSGDEGYTITTQSRGTSVKEFTLRRRASFTKIQRYGNNPSNYYFKVIATDGTVSWYGGVTGVDENAVVKTAGADSPIIHWALSKVQDVYGNNISYTYSTNTIQDQTGQLELLNGSKEIYLSEITYTGFKETPGLYKVKFINDTAFRSDVTFSARAGVKQSTSHLLKRISIEYSDNRVRSYTLNYITGQFNKPLLSSVTEYDKEDKFFYSHTFDYYNDIENGLFKATESIPLPNVDADFSAGFGNLLNPSKIGSTQTSSNGYTAQPTAGMEFKFGKLSQRLNTLLVGAPFGRSTAKSKGRIDLVDINGDGIDDIIYKTSNKLMYHAGGISTDFNGNRINTFDTDAKQVHNINEFSWGKMETNIVFGDSWNINLGFGRNDRSKFLAGTQRTKSKSEGTVYMVDANNDGLLDIVNNGKVQFNYIDTATGEPTFTSSSEVTPNLVLTGASAIGEPLEQQEEQEDPEMQQTFNDKYDVVRVRRFSYNATGVLKVFLENKGPGIAKFSVERTKAGSSTTELIYHVNLNPGDNIYDEIYEDNSETKTIFNKDDIYYFRLHHNETGTNPEIIFTPHFDIESNNPYPVENPDEICCQYIFISSDGIESLPGAGTVNIQWPSFSPLYYTAGVVQYRVYQRTIDALGNNNDILIYPPESNPGMGTFIPGNNNTISPSTNLNQIDVQDENTSFVFEAFSEPGALNRSYGWMPKLTYTPNQAAINSGIASYTKNIVPHYNAYHADDSKGFFLLLSASSDPTSPSWTTVSTPQTYTVAPNININPIFFTSDDNAEFIFLVKSGLRIIGSRKITITNGVISISDLSPITLISDYAITPYYNESGKFAFEFYVDGEYIEAFEKYKQAVNNNAVSVSYGNLPSQSHYTQVFTTFYNNLQHLGPMVYNWGQFLYNANFDTNPGTPTGPCGKLINTDIVMSPFEGIEIPSSPIFNNSCDPNLPRDEYQSCLEQSLINNAGIPDQNTDFENSNLDNILSSLETSFKDVKYNSPFMIMKPHHNGVYEKYIGLYNSQYFDGARVRAGGVQEAVADDSSSGGGLSFPDIDLQAEPAAAVSDSITGMKAINKIHRSSARSTNVGWGKYNVGKSTSSYSHGVTDFMDINGDGYPDIITTDAIQKTNITGGHMEPVTNTNTGNLTKGSSFNQSLVASRQFAVAGRHWKNGKSTGPSSTASSGNAPTAASATVHASLEASIGVGANANFGGYDRTTDYWSDLNGDGLPDRISKNEDNNTYGVIFNKGQNIFNSAQETFNNLGGMSSKPETIGISTSIPAALDAQLILSEANIAISASVNAGVTANGGSTEVTFIDINGDGLADKIENGSLYFNTGTGFSNNASTLSGMSLNNDSKNRSLGVYGSVGAFYGFTVCCWIIHVKAGFIFDAFSNVNISETSKAFKDLNGDGYTDFLVYEPGEIKVRYSAIGRTNMLKTVRNPLKGSFVVDYEVGNKTYNDPNGRWVMNKVEIFDGYDKVNDGYDSVVAKFVYEDGYYDRREREFYGYGTVKTLNYMVNPPKLEPSIYRTNVVKYYNQNYFLKGFVKERYILKGRDESAIFARTENIYTIMPVVTATNLIDTATSLPLTFDTGGTEGRKSAFAVLTATNTYNYELSSLPLVANTQIDYNIRGRIVKFTYLGSPSTTADNYITELTYHTTAGLINNNIINIAKVMRVRSHNSVLKRVKMTTVTDVATGKIDAVDVYSTPTEFATTLIKYTIHGNIESVTLPPNDVNQSMKYIYEYDAVQNKYLTKVQDSYGYISTTSYDPYFDKVIEQTDIAGSTIRYTYDNSGRLTYIKGPKESANVSYTIKMDYYPYYSDLSGVVNISENNFMPVAVTSHYDGSARQGNDIQTYTFIDGLARVVQVKKDIEMTISDSSSSEFMSVSGKTSYDYLGRAVQQFHPTYETKQATTNFVVNEYTSPLQSSLVTYDELDRVVSALAPDGSKAETQYSRDPASSVIITRTLVEQNGQDNIETLTHTDINGRVIKTVNVLSGTSAQNITTNFVYGPIGELLSYRDSQNITTSYTYDLMSRKLTVNNADSGLTSYTYDKASNLTSVQTANLAASTASDPLNRFIKYEYRYNRLTRIKYPPTNTGSSYNISNVTYQYGDSGNNTGRLIFQKDGTGTQYFSYGVLGELVSSQRTVIGPNIPERTYTTLFDYDTWNRIRKITYPDGENVIYTYDLGGNLKNVTGKTDNDSYVYIHNIQYDHYEQRTKIFYGNRTTIAYQYDDLMRRLTGMEALTSDKEKLFSNFYEYDKVGNITKVGSNTSKVNFNGMGGTYQHNYTYDNLNRLTAATGGHIKGNIATRSIYTMNMEYNATHGIVSKSDVTTIGNNDPTEYDDKYAYYNGTHRVRSIGPATTPEQKLFTYDLNGNMQTVTQNGQLNRSLYWDESNRLRAVDDQLQMHHYIYDASGERILKASSQVEALYQNGSLVNSGSVTYNSYTTYPSGYLTVKGDGEYTKHYYAGSQRIVSRVAPQNAAVFATQPTAATAKQVEEGPAFDGEALKQLQIKDLTAIMQKAGRGIPVFKEYKPAEPADTVRKAAQRTGGDATATAANFPSGNIYFFHPDHLGTTNYLTDADGQPYQMFMNKPFGETLAEEHSLTEDYETPYKFNGKELDSETGLYYYGARYYDPRTSIWLSVDPLAEKYPGISPYAYCANNPIMYIDPDGREIVLPGSKKAQDAYVKMLHASTGNNYSIVDNKLTLVGADANFKGTKSQTLINTIQSGIDAKDVYTMNLVGDKTDDNGVFIDSYSDMKIDISDLKTLGDASSALQGAAIGHFLNEVQVGGAFDPAHQASLGVEGVIYGELVGDNTITTRKDYATGAPQNGSQNVMYEYNSKNKFQLQQGATSTTKGTGQFIGPVEITETTVVPTGELKSAKKVP